MESKTLNSTETESKCHLQRVVLNWPYCCNGLHFFHVVVYMATNLCFVIFFASNLCSIRTFELLSNSATAHLFQTFFSKFKPFLLLRMKYISIWTFMIFAIHFMLCDLFAISSFEHALPTYEHSNEDFAVIINSRSQFLIAKCNGRIKEAFIPKKIV